MKTVLCACTTLSLLLALYCPAMAGETAKQKQTSSPQNQQVTQKDKQKQGKGEAKKQTSSPQNQQATQKDKQKQGKGEAKKQKQTDLNVDREVLNSMMGTKKPKDQKQATQPKQKKKEPQLTEKEKKQAKQLEKKMKDQTAMHETLGNVQKSSRDAAKSVTGNIR